MKIIQVILGQIPSHLKGCVQSVRDYALNNNIEYQAITAASAYFDEPLFECDRNRLIWRRHVSDWIRTKILATENNVIYFDWDIFLYDDFNILDYDKACFANDYIMYNGNQVDIFKKINDNLKPPSINCNYNLIELIRNIKTTQKFQGHFCHLDNFCNFKECYDLIK